MENPISVNSAATDNSGDLRNIAAIVLDVDGTLYDLDFVRRKMAAELIFAYVLRPVEGYRVFRFLKAYRHGQEKLRGADLHGKAAEMQFSLACEQARTDVEKGRVYLDRWFHSAPLQHVRAAARPGTTEFLSAMKARGIKVGVLSDYPAHAKLKALGLLDCLDSIVDPSDSGVRGFKPDPSGLLLCARNMGVAPQHVLYVGDRPETDAECARRAGAFAAIIAGQDRRSSDAGKAWHSAPSFASLLSDLMQTGVLA